MGAGRDFLWPRSGRGLRAFRRYGPDCWRALRGARPGLPTAPEVRIIRLPGGGGRVRAETVSCVSASVPGAVWLGSDGGSARPGRQGGGLGGGVIGECRAAIFLPGRAAPVKQSAASPWGSGMPVGARSLRALEVLPRTSLPPSFPALPPRRAPALPLVRVGEDALSPAAVPGVAVRVGYGCLSRGDRSPLHAWHGQVR